MQQLLTTEQVAGLLQVPVATLYAWHHGKKGPKPVKVGRHLRYRVADIEAWLSREAGPVYLSDVPS